MKYEPHKYQEYATQRIIDNKACALFIACGLGKTVITLTAIRRLKYERWEARKVLIIAPKTVAEDTWQSEAQKWDHLRGLRFSTVLGTAAQRKAALRERADIYVINRENTAWLVKELGHKWDFDTVVLDESTSFKSHQSQRFKAMRAIRPRIRRIVELTGTPDPHGLMDLWAQVFLLDQGQRLGRTITAYRDAYFLPDKRNGAIVYSYKPKAGAEQAITERISDLAVSMKAADYLDLPELIERDVYVTLDAAAKTAYARLERDALLEIDRDTVTAANAAALSSKLLQLCAGAIYTEPDEENGVTERGVMHVHDCKLDAFMELIESLNGEHAVVAYGFVHDKDRILAALKKAGKKVRVYAGAADKDAWNRGEIDILLIHPASCGYGLNLQQGGHHLIWFTPSWNLEEYLQACARLHRQGQKYPVIIHRLIVKGGRDEDVVKSLVSKDAAQERLLASLKARIDEVQGRAKIGGEQE